MHPILSAILKRRTRRPCLTLTLITCARCAHTCRQYLEKHLVPFAEANPHVDILVAKRPNKHPFVRAWYVRDRDKQLSLKNLSMEQVVERVQFLRDMRSIGLDKFARPFRTSRSVQGAWQMGQQLELPHRTIRSS